LPSTGNVQTIVNYQSFSPWASETFEPSSFVPITDFYAFTSSIAKDCVAFETPEGQCAPSSELLSILPTYSYGETYSFDPPSECVFGLAPVNIGNVKGYAGKDCGSWGTQDCNDYSFSPLQHVSSEVIDSNSTVLSFFYPKNGFFEDNVTFPGYPSLGTVYPQYAFMTYDVFDVYSNNSIQWVEQVGGAQVFCAELQIGNGTVAPTIVDSGSRYVYCDADCAAGFFDALNAFLDWPAEIPALDNCDTKFTCPSFNSTSLLDEQVTLDIVSANGNLLHTIAGTSLVQPLHGFAGISNICECLVKVKQADTASLGVPAFRDVGVYFWQGRARPQDCTYESWINETTWINSTMVQCSAPIAVGWGPAGFGNSDGPF
jgi:hypothetical protein